MSLPSPAPDRREAADYGGAAQFVAGVMIFLGVLVGLWPVFVPLATSQPLQVVPIVAHVCGMLAGYGVLVLMCLMSRWPVLERGAGSDRLARWHSNGGRTVLVLVLLHAWAAVSAWADRRSENMFIAFWHVLGLPGLVSATVATAALVVVAVVSIRAARRRMSYEAWHAVHLSVYVAIALWFLHQLAGPDLAGHRVLQVP